MPQHASGTDLYAAGDIANPAGFGTSTRREHSARCGATYDMARADGGELRGLPTMLVGKEEHGHHGSRCVTRAADAAHWTQRAEEKPYFHDIEHLTIDDAGYVSWQGKHVEHFDPDFA